MGWPAWHLKIKNLINQYWISDREKIIYSSTSKVYFCYHAIKFPWPYFFWSTKSVTSHCTYLIPIDMPFFHEPRTDTFYSYTLKNKKYTANWKPTWRVICVMFSENIALQVVHKLKGLFNLHEFLCWKLKSVVSDLILILEILNTFERGVCQS